MAKLFKSFIRPILMYGLDCLNLNKDEIRSVKKTEGIILKEMIGVGRWCTTTAIYAALHIDSTVNSLIKNKLGLYQRLINNEFTCELLKQTMDVPKSITEEVIDIVNKPNETFDAELEIKRKINEINDYELKIRTSLQAIELKTIIGHPNMNIRRLAIQNITRYDYK